MNIKDFLIDNYIYILVVILLIIITIIGFLADKKKSKDKLGNDVTNQQQPMPNMQQPMNFQPNNQKMAQPINYQTPDMLQQNNNMMTSNVQPQNFNQNVANNPLEGQLNQNLNQPVVSPLENNMNVIPQPIPNQIMQNMNIQPESLMANNNNPNIQNSVQPVENVNQVNNINPEPIYQPLSEQKPTFNTPTEFVPIQENYNQNIMNMPQNSIMPESVQPTIMQPMLGRYQNQVNEIPIQTQSMNNESFNIPNVEPTNNTMQENFNTIPVNSVNNNIYSGAQSMNQPMNNTIPNPVTPPQPVSPQPINFVYGPQQNNNQNM